MIGGGLSSPQAALGDAEAEAWRAHALRATRAVAQVPICGVLMPVFEAARGGPTARLVRLLGLLGSLPAALATLHGAVQRQTRTERWWTHHPRGGRIDIPASLLAQARASARPWRLVRVRPCANTPTNTLVASALADVGRRIDAMRRVVLYRTEQTAFERAERLLHRFLAQSPLGEVAPVDRARWITLRQDSRRRVAEYQAVLPFLRWWDAMRRTHLETLRADDAPLSVGGCFELAVLVHLVAGFADRSPIVEPPAPGTPSLHLGGQAIWIRNLDADTAEDVRGLMGAGVLLTPADVLDDDGVPDFRSLVQRMRYALA